MPEQFFKVANWPATISDLRSDDPLSVQAWARQVKDWQDELLRILDHTLATEGAGVGEIIEEIPFPPTRVLFAGAAGQITTDAEFTYDAATDIGTIGGLIVSGATAAGKAMVRRTATQYLDLWGDASAEWIAAISADTAKKPLFIFNLQATQTIGFGIGAAALANLQLMISDGAAYPYVTNDLDLGLSSRLFKDAYAYRFLHQAGAVGTPSVAATNDLHTGLFWPADHAVGVSLGGAEYLRFSISGGHCLLTLS